MTAFRILDHLAARILSAWFSASDLIVRGVR